MKKYFWFLVTATLVCASAVFGETGERQYESAAHYSICPPKSWEAMSFPGMGKMFLETGSEYPAQMTFVSNYKPGITLEKKLQENMPRAQRAMPGYQSVSTSDFTTTKGLKGKKHIYTFKAQEYNMRAVMYSFVDPKGYSVTITCGALAEYGNKYDSVFDESVKTLEFTN